MKNVYLLVRHGPTPMNEQRIYVGKRDDALSITGIETALNLQVALKSIRIGHAYTSPLRRARDTAMIALGMAFPVREGEAYSPSRLSADGVFHNIPLVEDPRLSERDMGLLTGQPYRPLFPEDELGMERSKDLHSRVVDFFEEISTRHHRQTILVVSHFGPIERAIRYFLRLPWNVPLNQHIEHCQPLMFEQ